MSLGVKVGLVFITSDLPASVIQACRVICSKDILVGGSGCNSFDIKLRHPALQRIIVYYIRNQIAIKILGRWNQL